MQTSLIKVAPSYYTQPTVELARALLGKVLVSDVAEQAEATGSVGGLIVETEAYVGQDDPACHAYVGRTTRNAVMWGEPGCAYVYFTYGVHWMLNVVTERADYPAAVLIRAVQPLWGLELMRQRRRLDLGKGKATDRNLTNGPGKLCQAFAITGALNGQSLQSDQLYLAEPPAALPLLASPPEIVQTTRIGITRGVELPWRFYFKGNRFVSRFL